MLRTKDLPIPLSILSLKEAILFSLLIPLVGLYFLYLCSLLTAIIRILSIFLYVFAYTLLKKKTPWAIFVGVFPGALPVLIRAVTGQADHTHIEFFSIFLFFIQFIRQFPHFWTLAWFNYDDYARAGF